MELKGGVQAEWEQLPESRNGSRPGLRSALGGLVAAVGVVLILAAAALLGLQDQALVAGVASTASVTPSPLPITRTPDMSSPSPVPPSPTPTPAVATATATHLPSSTPTLLPSATPVPPTVTPTASPSATPTASPSATPTRSARAAQIHRSTPTSVARTRCTPNPPQGWQRYTVKKGETLRGLAARFGVSANELMTVNCLSRASVRARQKLWVPSVVPTPKG